VCEATGEVEKEDGVLVIKRIHAKMFLQADAGHRETVERVFGFFADRCPVYKTLKPAIAFTLEWELLPPLASQ
jgi:uncharacterized OsmC-like protein